MTSRAIGSLVLLALLACIPAPAAQAPAEPASVEQVWRVPSLDLAQRTSLAAIVDRPVAGDEKRDSKGSGAEQATLAEALKLLTPAQTREAAAQPVGALALEERIYYAALSAPGLAPAIRTKIEEVFAGYLEEARRQAREQLDDDRGVNGVTRQEAATRRQQRYGERAIRVRALVEVLDMLLADEQLLAVLQTLPESLRNQAYQRDAIMSLWSLTPDQAARVQALYAADDDETASDRARMYALETEVKEKGVSGDQRKVLQSERTQVADKLSARALATQREVFKVLTTSQLKDLAISSFGSRQPMVLLPETIAALPLTNDQRQQIDALTAAYERSSQCLRSAIADLRTIVAAGPMDSVELAPARAILQRRQVALEAERRAMMRRVVDVLKGPEIALLIEQTRQARRQPSQAPQEAPKVATAP